MGFHDFSCYNPMQARPGLDFPRPSGILASAQNEGDMGICGVAVLMFF